jgi:hypothetical protein
MILFKTFQHPVSTHESRYFGRYLSCSVIVAEINPCGFRNEKPMNYFFNSTEFFFGKKRSFLKKNIFWTATLSKKARKNPFGFGGLLKGAKEVF